MTLKGAVQEKDAALESARQEIEALKATISDKDSALLGHGPADPCRG
jgi:hypothetical protein